MSTVLGGGFPPYSVGRAWKHATWAWFQVEERDRTVARSGPHSGPPPWQPQAAKITHAPKKNKNKNDHQEKISHGRSVLSNKLFISVSVTPALVRIPTLIM